MRVLVLAPHADDEVYGCGGMIHRYVAEGHEVDIVIMTMGTVSVPGHGTKCTEEERLSELKLACSSMGVAEVDVIFSGFENCLGQVGDADNHLPPRRNSRTPSLRSDLFPDAFSSSGSPDLE